MRELRIAGRSVRQLAQQFNVSEGAVCAITSGRTWRHVQGPLYDPGSNTGVGNPTAKLSRDDVCRIRRLWETKQATQMQLAEHYSELPGRSRTSFIGVPGSM